MCWWRCRRRGWSPSAAWAARVRRGWRSSWAKRLRTRESGEISEITYWVPLAAVTDPSDVPAAVAEGIGLRVAPGPGATVAVVNALQGHRSRLVLDNCEHLAVACRDVLKDLLPGCRGLSVVATSRIPLGLDDEQVYAAPPMGDEAKIVRGPG